MQFEARQLKKYSEPVTAEELSEGKTYFIVQFVDDEMYVPVVEPIVYIGCNLVGEDADEHYFQDAESYRDGIRFEDEVIPKGVCISAQHKNALNHIFIFERALEVLMGCSLRRAK